MHSLLRIGMMSFALAAAPPSTARNVNIGDTFETVFTKLGKPAGRHERGKVYWLRKTATNEFRIDPGFREDTSVSKLHPPLRVEEISFSPDRRQPWRKMLSQIAEARSACSKNCNVLFHIKQGSPLSDTELVACPTEPDVIDGAPDFLLSGGEVCVAISFEAPSARVQYEEDVDDLEVNSICIFRTDPKRALMEFRSDSYDDLTLEPFKP